MDSHAAITSVPVGGAARAVLIEAANTVFEKIIDRIEPENEQSSGLGLRSPRAGAGQAPRLFSRGCLQRRLGFLHGYGLGTGAGMMRGEYERDVCTRAEAGVRVSFIEASIGAWKPKVAECHENVDHWVKHHPGCTAVRGWLAYASYGSDDFGYTAHSVVRGSDGNLFDITPTIDPEYQRGRFVIHVGDEQTFLEMKDLSNQIRCQGYCPAPMLGLDVLLRSS
ncbi:hypothetical protein KGO5_05282 [Sinorhizobium sp. KGO-5]|nr:hypothetical protein KGO5_05282 [Sinorhizobium sp. KGO-5]